MMRRHSIIAVAALAAAAGAATDTASADQPDRPPLRLAQSVNETLPGGVEHRPGEGSLGSTRSAAPRAITPPPPAPAAAMPTPQSATDAAKPAPPAAPAAETKKSKKSAPRTLERAPAAGAPPQGEMERTPAIPRPKGPDESIPGGAERSPGNTQ